MSRFSVAPVLLVLIACVAAAAAVGADEVPMIELGPAEGQKPAEKPAEDTAAKEPAESKSNSADKKPFAGGVIEGKILPAKRVKSVRLVERMSGQSRAAVYDPHE